MTVRAYDFYLAFAHASQRIYIDSASAYVRDRSVGAFLG